MTYDEIDELIERMTLDEKCAQLGSLWHLNLRTADSRLDMGKAAPLLINGIGQIAAIAGAPRITCRL